MAIKHVATKGYGFADLVTFIPTRGYTPGTVVEISGIFPGATFLRTQADATFPRTSTQATFTRTQSQTTLPRLGDDASAAR